MRAIRSFPPRWTTFTSTPRKIEESWISWFIADSQASFSEAFRSFIIFFPSPNSIMVLSR